MQQFLKPMKLALSMGLSSTILPILLFIFMSLERGQVQSGYFWSTRTAAQLRLSTIEPVI